MASLEIHVNSVVNANLQAYAIKLQEFVHMVVSRATEEIYALPNVTMEHLGKTACRFATVRIMHRAII